MRGTLSAIVLIASFFSVHTARACDLDHSPSTRWTIARHGLVSELVTPCGDGFFSTGVNVLDAGITAGYLDRPHYDWRNSAGSIDEWVIGTRERLDRWGFNSAGAWSLPPQQMKLPSVINLELGRLARFHWFDPFDPAAIERVYDEAKVLTAPYRDSPYRIGYFADNEVGWWDGALFLFYSQKPAASFTKQRWLNMLHEDYRGDWKRFAADFVPPPSIESWDALLKAELPTKLRAGGHGMVEVERWTGIVAGEYYKVAREALKAADPNALFFGDRLPIYYDEAAIRAEAPYVDAIAINYNVDSPEGWLAPYFFDGLRKLTNGKAELISEWFFAARENRTGNQNNGHLMTVETQGQRASGAAASAKLFANVPEIVGEHWFQYYDYPVGGRADSEDYNFGLVDIRNQPYETLVAALTAANHDLPIIHDHAAPIARPTAKNFAIPYATIDPKHLSLIDWPKPASLLPPLKASPGSVPFAEAYLTWSKDGLALATIGQDYDDLGLLDYGDSYPLSEAYRLELDIDAGAGPKRFTLYFIPPKGSTKDYPPMAPKLCAGAVDELPNNDCTQVPGAQALYFGADQPRIVAEALLPWSAFGIDDTAPPGKLKLEVSAVSWDNGRWASLSGLPPQAGSDEPKRWLTVPLAAE